MSAQGRSQLIARTAETGAAYCPQAFSHRPSFWPGSGQSYTDERRLNRQLIYAAGDLTIECAERHVPFAGSPLRVTCEHLLGRIGRTKGASDVRLMRILRSTIRHMLGDGDNPVYICTESSVSYKILLAERHIREEL